MISPTAQSKQWAKDIQISITEMNDKIKLEPRKNHRLSRKSIPYMDMAKLIAHSCRVSCSQLLFNFHCVQPKEGFPEMTNNLPLIRVNFLCSVCSGKECIYLFEDGSLIVGKTTGPPVEQKIPFPLGDSHGQRTVKNASKKRGFYWEKLDTTEILKYEHPAKFETEEQLMNFCKNFPKQQALIDESISALKRKAENNPKLRARSLFNPGKQEYIESILPMVKKISGCEVNIIRHTATESLFENVDNDKKLVTFYLECR